MSRTFDVEMTTTAYARMQMTLSSERLDEIARELEVTPDELTPSDLIDYIIDDCAPPELCGACAGAVGDHTLELGDEWDIDSNMIEETIK